MYLIRAILGFYIVISNKGDGNGRRSSSRGWARIAWVGITSSAWIVIEGGGGEKFSKGRFHGPRKDNFHFES